MWPLTLFNICLLRANPQDLPASTPLTVFMLLAYFTSDVVTAMTSGVPAMNSFQAAAMDTFLLTAMVQLVLNFRGFQIRVRQTLTALAGAGAMLAALTLAVVSVLPEMISTVYPWILSVLWMFAVYGWILRHAFGVSYTAGIVATGTYFIISLLVTAPFLVPPQP